MEATRRQVLIGGMSALSCSVAEGSVIKGICGGRNGFLANDSGEDEEEMYKEMYLAMITGVSSFGDTLVDNVSTTIRGACFWNFPNSITKVVFNNVVGVVNVIGAFRNAINMVEVELPYVTAFGSNAFTNCTKLQTVRAPNCKNFGVNCFQASSNVKDIFITNINKSESVGFPWNITTAGTVFHFSDGDYDYQGNPI